MTSSAVMHERHFLDIFLEIWEEASSDARLFVLLMPEPVPCMPGTCPLTAPWQLRSNARNTEIQNTVYLARVSLEEE